ncbi:Hemolysin secretion protein D, chromosomal [Pirellulimonas nuda]|uniref:Hemolysin secretion protein D, chromosomal n=1 Tax=Pirellulimonas nuda TaxID=2528009 RepID=A0A518DE29_9BACT|nr:HlyD family efflux transporter periplasmic adaptor subunit [Pirellulimonas nuda]QDU89727.1 Hemolysin secretion protein D, chromosomal [Pirellulimonas nuda]
MTLPTKHPKSPPLTETAYSEIDFPSLRLTRSSRLARRLARWLLFSIAVAMIAMIFAPWQQSVRGDGSVVAFDPVNRTQSVQSPVKGVIDEIGEGIFENAEVKKGQLVYRIVDQDPQYLSRINQQVENTKQQIVAAQQRLERTEDQLTANQQVIKAKQDELASTRSGQIEAMAAADAYVLMAENKLAAERAGLVAAEGEVWQTELEYNRKKSLSEQGFESGKNFQEAELKYRQAMAKLKQAEQYVGAAENEVEGKKKDRESKRQEWEGKINKVDSELAKSQSDVAKSRGDIAKTNEEIGKIQNELTKLETQYARQQTQEVRAPRDGFIMRLLAYDRSAIVKQGDTLFTIVPKTDKPAVQLWVDGNDQPLISPGRHVRLQFEGWPAAQFSGWPSVAVGTFGGEVAFVDPTDDDMGKFRVVVVPDDQSDPWPKYPYLRQGVRAKGWVLLNRVPLGYEVWRRLNGFPPSLKSSADAEKADSSKPPKVKI